MTSAAYGLALPRPYGCSLHNSCSSFKGHLPSSSFNFVCDGAASRGKRTLPRLTPSMRAKRARLFSLTP